MSTTTFRALGVPAALCAELARQGIETPFPIQAETLPDTLEGRDVLGRGRTGSGKTLAFSLPLVARLSGGARKPRQARALVLVPTRELAKQVLDVLQPLAKATGLTTATVYGGVGQYPQVKALSRGVDVLIACPGRLEDLIRQGYADLSAVEVTVLDEADHMADLGFLPAVTRLLDQTPKRGQRMLFSATLDNDVEALVSKYLHQPTNHSVDPEVAPVSTMTHHVFMVSADEKADVVRELASGHGRSVLFMRTKHSATKLASQLTLAGVPAAELHGNLTQKARERNLAAFARGTTRVLVATDIAARGIHVDDVTLVVHVDPPAEHKAYLHRSGRTARAGAEGVVVTMATHAQARAVRTLTKRAGITPETTKVRPGDEAITELTGPPAPYVAPRPVVAEPVRRTVPKAARPESPQRPGRRRDWEERSGSRRQHSGGAATRETTRRPEAVDPAPGRAASAAPSRGPRRAGAAQGPARPRVDVTRGRASSGAQRRAAGR